MLQNKHYGGSRWREPPGAKPGSLRFDGGEGDGVDDVLHQSTTGQVVYRLVETLQHRADGQGAGGALHGFVADVAGAQVREDEHVDVSGHIVALGLGGGYGGGPGGVELDGTDHRQIRSLLLEQLGGFLDHVHVRSLAGAEGGVGEHTDLRVDAEGTCGLGGLQRDFGKLLGIRVEVEQVDSAAWSDMKKNGGVDCGISNWYVDYSDPESMLYPMTKTDSNSSFWHNAEFDQLLEDGIATTDPAERQEIYAKAEHIMTREDWATTPLYNETKFYLLNPKITGFKMNATFRMFWKNADIQQ